MADEKDNSIETPQALYEQFLANCKKVSSASPLETLLTGSSKARALVESADLALKFVIANELHRIANALEKANA